MKDQYNTEIRKRNVLKARKSRVEDIKNERLFSEIWKYPVEEDNIFSMFAHDFSLHPTLNRVLLKFYPKKLCDEVILGSQRNSLFPGYYSDRERIVVMLGRYRASGNLEDFINWIPYYEEREAIQLLHLSLGIIGLNECLSFSDTDLLKISIFYLEKSRSELSSDDATLAHSALMSFSHHMGQSSCGTVIPFRKDC